MSRCCSFVGRSRGHQTQRKTAEPKPSQNYRLVNIEKAGHWVHHDQLAAFLKAVREFLS